jgi:glycosyltransferase involved in cell wall biosynthesis
VINQTFQDWELLVVDDGSQDNTFEILNPYLEKYRNIRYFKHQNRKQALSKNVGIMAAFGKYITFLDSDDIYKINHLESRLTYMKYNPDVDLIEGGVFMEEEFFVVDYFQPQKTINIRDCVLGATFFGKRQVFGELNGFTNLPFAEDTEFWERAKKIFNTQKIREPETYVYTRAETSITKSFLEKNS